MCLNVVDWVSVLREYWHVRQSVIVIEAHYKIVNYYIEQLCAHTPIQGGLGPLYVASLGGHTEVVDILLDSGADPNQACIVW